MASRQKLTRRWRVGHLIEESRFVRSVISKFWKSQNGCRRYRSLIRSSFESIDSVIESEDKVLEIKSEGLEGGWREKY